MALDESWAEISAVSLNDIPGLIFTETTDGLAKNCYVFGMNFSGQDVDDVGITYQQIGLLLVVGCSDGIVHAIYSWLQMDNHVLPVGLD
jgi:hypothetical protein